MSFALPSVKAKPTLPEEFGLREGNFGVPNLMVDGLNDAKSSIDTSHPLAASEFKYRKNQEEMNLTVLRNTQGLHAPLRIAMELKFAKMVGRHPFLQSSNAMYDSLTGRDLEVGPEDIFNIPEFWESRGQPHAVVDKADGLL